MELFVEIRFEAAHRLPNVAAGHKCARVHGHSYRARFTLDGPIDPATGWVMDFAEVEAAIEPHRARLDHHYLNEVEGLENPTAEHLARWLWNRLAPDLPLLVAVEVRETDDAGCVYRGPAG
jgi:6-pyruvoyltetrahydropterin/6-carboxytetrahydropterin synthase